MVRVGLLFVEGIESFEVRGRGGGNFCERVSWFVEREGFWEKTQKQHIEGSLQ